MEITSQKTGELLVIRLAGRLDASWCDPVERALTAAIREGEHRLRLDMAQVDYISSAGLRVLFSVYKQLLAIKGTFGIQNPSSNVRSVLDLVGIASLITGEVAETPAEAEKGRTISTPEAAYEIFIEKGHGMRLAMVGRGEFLKVPPPRGHESRLLRFGDDAFAIGIGALGESLAACETRFGEFLAVAGAAAFLPADGSPRPDFVLSEGSLVPEGHLLLGLLGSGDFPFLARFEAAGESRLASLSALAAEALKISGAPAAAIVAVAETSALVGASLRRSPAVPDSRDRFGFPQIRDWLSFTSERAFRDTTSLVAGVVAREGSPCDALLRPLTGDLLGHFHAVNFPYRPLQKGRIALRETVAGLFDGHVVNTVLHLIPDHREINGAGESEFSRGALWIAPILSEP